MDNNLTISTLAYNFNWSDETGSQRTEIARGASLPTKLLIKHAPYTDTKYKVSGTRSFVRFDHYMAMTDGVIRPVSLQLTLMRPTDPLVTTAIIEALEAQMVNLIHGTTNTNGLDLRTEIFAGGEQ
jgi:hypothetical protein